MSGSFESVRWNACVHRLDLALYSHPKEFGGMESEPMLTPREKSPLPEECMCAQTRPRFILPSERVWGNGVRTHVNSKGTDPLYQRLREGSNPRRSITQDSEPNTLPTELFWPPGSSKCANHRQMIRVSPGESAGLLREGILTTG